MQSVINFVNVIVDLIIQPIVVLLMVAALVYFIWGVALFILNAGDDKKREELKQHLLWGVIGFFIMVSVLGILQVVTATFCDTPLCRL